MSTNEFYTAASFTTLATASALTWVVTSGLRQAFGINPRWLGLVVAEIVSLAGAYFTQHPIAGQAIILALFNGFLIYATATGANAMTARRQPISETEGHSATEFHAAADDHSVADARTVERHFRDAWFDGQP